MKKRRNVLSEDIENIIEMHSNCSLFRNKTVLITGATGLIGSLLARTFLSLEMKYRLNLEIVLHSRNTEKSQELYSEYLSLECIKFIHGDIMEPISYPNPISYIFHCASITSSAEMVTKPVETIATILEGTKNVMEYAREHSVESVVFLSSMEVYGMLPLQHHKISESEVGNIDILNVRSSYSEGKRLAECLCVSYYSEYQVPVKIARLAQTFGPGTSLNDNRIFMQFANSSINLKNIVLHTLGESVGNYCYTMDCISGLTTILLKGTSGEAYNVVNENSSMTIAEMAHMVADEITDHKIEVVYDIPSENKYGYAPATQLRMSNKKLRELGWNPKTDLRMMYIRLIEYIRNMKE